MASSDSIQSAFLEEVKKRLPSNLSFVDELAEILSISKDSAYRRIRGETVLSLDEAKKLCGRFGVSIDSLFTPTSNMVPFMDRSPSENYTLEQWLTSILRNVEMLTEITYAAKDIPIFHYLRHPELAAFKMFFWQKTIIENPEYKTQTFKPGSISKEMIQLGNRIWTKYAAIPSVEIWAVEAINNTLKQIEFYQECSFFSDSKQAPQLCDHLIELIRTVQADAADARKSGGSIFNLYQNEILMSDNTISAKSGDKRLSYLNYNTISLLITQHDLFCEKTEKYLNGLIKHSTLISGTAEKERIKFFTKMTNRIEEFKQKL
ncbi:MAG TPA: helix-turn-helix transcriptional regulator [Chryseolinea sp.]|nr:helix-turn-helix transcriptional regulator [Chryseolinea sp.]